jgi:hypothetical protein
MSVAQKVASRWLKSYTGMPGEAEGFVSQAEAALKAHDQLQTWLKGFPKALRQAVEKSDGLEPGRVWTKMVSDLWDGREGYREAQSWFEHLNDLFDDIALDVDYLGDEARMCQHATSIPRNAQIEVVMSSVQHEEEPPPGAGPTWALSYDTDTVERWAKALGDWSKQAEALLNKALKSAKRKISRRKS